MAGFGVSFIVGIICIVLGISHTRGNISLLHSYHRNRVAPEDELPFGKQVGLGTIIMGCAIIIFSALSAVALYTENELFTTIGTVVMIVGMIIGIVITFKAMIKYNKGIF